MLAAVVWPGRDWAEDALQARFAPCPACGGRARCDECGGTGLVTTRRSAFLMQDLGARVPA
jgi:hypothetical protein